MLMKSNILNHLCHFHDSALRPKPFAGWARSKSSELDVKRTRYLGENQEVIWDIKADGYEVSDHIEMAGFYVSAIISYGNDSEGRLRIMKHLTFPMLRFQPNLTGSSFSHNFDGSFADIKLNGRIMKEYPEGNRAHLAAESLLFARIITEGLFGLKAVGLNKLRINPQLSSQCDKIALENIKLFSKCFDIKANEKGIDVIYNGSTYHTKQPKALFDFNACQFE